MEEREISAILKWLDLQDVTRERIKEEPMKFVLQYLDLLPPHLLLPFGSVLTPQQRGTTERIRERRRQWARHVQPEELSVVEARKRNPLLYKTITSTLQRRGDNSSTTSRPNYAAPSSSRGVVKPENVESQARFASVVDRLDEEDVLETLKRQQRDKQESDHKDDDEKEEQNVARNRRGMQVEEEGEEEETDSNDDDEATKEDQFRAEVLQRFVRGDPSLPADMYLCDFDDRWDVRTQANSSRDSEDRWFNEEDEGV